MKLDKYTANWHEARETALQAGHRIIETGWEQHVIIDDERSIVYRYPRHDRAAAKLKDEVPVLRDVNARHWPIRLPVMREHTEKYNSYDYIPGVVLDEVRVSTLHNADFEQIGRRLGEFLVDFHRIDPKVVAQKQTKHSGSLLSYYAHRISESTSEVFAAKAKPALHKLLDLQNGTPDVVVHGDLHGPNVIIDPKINHLNGVIDLSEMEVGNPHLEFRKIFMSFPASLRSTMKAYQQGGGAQLSEEEIIQWAYVNEWGNLCHFADETKNVTYQRALANLKRWGQL